MAIAHPSNKKSNYSANMQYSYKYLEL